MPTEQRKIKRNQGSKSKQDLIDQTDKDQSRLELKPRTNWRPKQPEISRIEPPTNPTEPQSNRGTIKISITEPRIRMKLCAQKNHRHTNQTTDIKKTSRSEARAVGNCL